MHSLFREVDSITLMYMYFLDKIINTVAVITKEVYLTSWVSKLYTVKQWRHATCVSLTILMLPLHSDLTSAIVFAGVVYSV